jgi:hypothetical protein
VSQLIDRSLEPLDLAAKHARHWIAMPQLVQDGAANAVFRVDGESLSARRIELIGGVDEADSRDPDEIFALDVRGQTHTDLTDDLANQIGVLLGQSLGIGFTVGWLQISVLRCFVARRIRPRCVFVRQYSESTNVATHY